MTLRADRLKGNYPTCWKWLSEQISSRVIASNAKFSRYLRLLILRMTLRADRLKSNYLGCWIFEISSAPDLDPFSILFFVFLDICSVEFDKFHLVFVFWVARGLGTLRLTRLWIYIWVFKKLHLIIWLNFFKKSWKNDVSQIDQGSIQEAPQSFRASKNMHLNALEASGTIKNIKILKKW